MSCPGRIVTERIDPIVSPGAVSGHVHTVSGGNVSGQNTRLMIFILIDYPGLQLYYGLRLDSIFYLFIVPNQAGSFQLLDSQAVLSGQGWNLH